MKSAKLFFALGIFLSNQLGHEAFAWQKKKGDTQKKVKPKIIRDTDLPYPPKLPGNRNVVTDQSKKFLVGPESIKRSVKIAATPPTVDFLFYPEQNYPGKPWSNWGDGCFANGKLNTIVSRRDRTRTIDRHASARPSV